MEFAQNFIFIIQKMACFATEKNADKWNHAFKWLTNSNWEPKSKFFIYQQLTYGLLHKMQPQKIAGLVTGNNQAQYKIADTWKCYGRQMATVRIWSVLPAKHGKLNNYISP